MNKSIVKKALIAKQHTIIRELQEKIVTTHSMVDIDEEMTHDPEDYSHQYESQEIEQLVKVQLNRANGGLLALQSINFGPKKTVTSGAVVKTDRTTFFIGFATVPFDLDGIHIVGISLASPIFPIMAAKKAGDTFSFGGIEYTIENIY